jgi:hypothetical protein
VAGSSVQNKIVFPKKGSRGGIDTATSNGMEKRFDEIHRKVERLTVNQKVTNGGIVSVVVKALNTNKPKRDPW